MAGCCRPPACVLPPLLLRGTLRSLATHEQAHHREPLETFTLSQLILTPHSCIAMSFETKKVVEKHNENEWGTTHTMNSQSRSRQPYQV